MTGSTMQVTDFERRIGERAAESIYARAHQAQGRNERRIFEAGRRLAGARHPKLLRTLEQLVERVDAMSEAQQGRQVRAATDAYRTRHTEHQIVRLAYEAADRGYPLEPYSWVFGAAAEFAGLIPR